MNNTNKDLRVDKEQRRSHHSTAATPEEISSYIAFQLAELSAKNAHHDFEHLCTHLGRKRISPNILPSTGPVSGGGDQGADSESYCVIAPGGQTEFFAAATEDKIVFACSLEKNVKKKVEADLRLASELPHRPLKLYFFTSQLVQTGTRHKLQKHAKDVYDIHLEILDRRALSELLADRDVFWIAQRYLSIPNELMPPLPESVSEWYAHVLARVDSGLLSEFIDLKYAVRRATFSESLHSDLPVLIERLTKYLDHPIGHIRRKAFYEIFVASLRGLELTAGYEDSLEKYFREIPELYDSAELEDAAVLLQYCYGAEFRGLLVLEAGTLDAWRQLMLARLQKLLESAIDPSRKCQLMMDTSLVEILGQMRLRNVVEIKRVIKIWKSMLRLIPSAPMKSASIFLISPSSQFFSLAASLASTPASARTE